VGSFSDTSAAQIRALQKVKSSLSASERRLGSDLALRVKAAADPSIAAALPKLAGTLSKSATALVAVDISATVTSSLLARIRSLGGHVAYASVRESAIRASVPTSSLAQLAASPGVRSVRSAVGAITANARPAPPKSKAKRASSVDANLAAALAATDTVTSEGDATHAADTARAKRHVSGVGVKVCVLSDGVDSLAASQAAGELPAVDVLPGQHGEGDEGTAMLEIVHDLAPGASLGFATAFTSAASFADNIRALRTIGHCKIIVDDVLYLSEASFQDGPIAQAVNDVTASGALYFSSAGNEGSVLSGSSANYEGMFVDSGQSVGKFRGAAHDFAPDTSVQVYEPVSYSGFFSQAPAILQWADPLGAAADDYDLYLFDSDGNVAGFSQDVQDGTQDPFEILGVYDMDMRPAVVEYAGADRYFQMSTLRGRYRDSAGLTAYVTPGVTRGHSAAVRAFSVAAAPAAESIGVIQPGDPEGPTGPFPGVFTTAQQPEVFSSDGPRRMFFAADGTPAEQVRQKPDITAADGVTTSLPDFTPFFGTSASAPHAAAIAALVLSGNPGASAAFVRKAFTTTALDLAPAGPDTRSGKGLIRADRVLANTGATPQPLVVAGTPLVVSSTDGDAYLEPGERAQVAIPVTNTGDGAATAVSLALTSASTGAAVTPRTTPLGRIAAGASKTATVEVSVPSSWVVGTPVALSARVTFVGVLSPTVGALSVPTGKKGSPVSFSYGGSPVAIPDDDIAGASVTIPVSGIGVPAELTFSVDGATCSAVEGATTVGIDHTYVGDLTGTLTSPTGMTATVFDASGGSGNNMCQVVFDDTASAPFTSVSSSQAPFTGTWKPASPLASVLSGSADGDWTFHVVDGAGGDTGSIRAVSLTVTGYVSG
jgi:subtilisin-like proprotein convertase family protein